jgi:hypothetical protein
MPDLIAQTTTDTWKQPLKAVRIPVSLADQAAIILQKEAENPHYKRTLSEQETINHSWKWFAAQGRKVDE